MKDWFILIEDKQEGPYSLQDLKRHRKVTPDTLVWKEGFENWVALRHVPELQDIFKDEPESQPIQDRIKPKPTSVDLQQEQDTLALGGDPFPYYLWILLFLLVIIYFIFRANS